MTHLRDLGRLAFPQGLTLALLFASSAFFFGADHGAASLVFSSGFLAIAAASLLANRLTFGAPTLVFVALFLAFTALAQARGWLATGLPEYASLAAAGGVLLIARSGALRLDQARLLWTATLLLGGVVAAAALISFAIEPSVWLGRVRPYHGDRLSAPFLSANTAATFYGIIALMALATVMRRLRSVTGPGASRLIDSALRKTSFSVVIFALASAALLMTASRGGIVIVFALCFILIAWDALRGGERSRSTVKPVASIAGAIILVIGLGAVFLALGELFNERIERVGQDAATRSLLISTYWDAVRFAPVFGHGLGGFQYVNDLAANAQNASLLVNQGAAHNVYLQWLLQAGMVGAGAMLAFVLVLLETLRRGLGRHSRGLSEIRAVVLIFALVGLHGLVDYALEIPGVVWLLAWVAGLGLGLAQRRSTGARMVQPRPARALSIGLGLVFLAGVFISGVAGDERLRASTIATLPDDAFNQIIETGSEVNASYPRLNAIANRAFYDPAHAPAAVGALEALLLIERRDGAAWARLAFARHVSGAPGQEVDQALARSYLLKPYADTSFRRWRLEFAAAVWRDLEADTRAAVLREVRMEGPAWRRRWLARLPR